MAIVTVDDVFHGLPRRAGTRISVLNISNMGAAGAGPANLADSLDIPLARVHDTLSHYCDYPDEMRRRREAEDEVLAELPARTTAPPVRRETG